jgi:uncharacterized protein (DUF302 family)
MLIKMESKKSLDQVCQDLEKAVMANKFGVMTIHNLNETMAKKGVQFDRPCRIFEVCNPHQAKKVLENNINISTFLPCRISVFTDGDRVVLTTLKRGPGSGRGPFKNHAGSRRLIRTERQLRRSFLVTCCSLLASGCSLLNVQQFIADNEKPVTGPALLLIRRKVLFLLNVFSNSY